MPAIETPPPVLCVDLDGTLVRTDTMLEAVFALLRRQPFAVFALLWWMLRGRVHFKRRLAGAVTLDPVSLPYNEALLDYLRGQHSRGRRLALATASHRRTAEGIAAHIGLFAEVHATDAQNLKGVRKAEALEARHGRKGFAYAGDSRADLPVWDRAAAAVLVGVAASTRAALLSTVVVEKEFAPVPRGKELLRALRPHQWVKNALVFVALVTAHHYLDPHAVAAAAAAFVAVSLAASAVYVVNDLMDLAADRRHPTKRLRPFAAGTLPLAWGLVASPVLLLAAAVVAAFLPTGFSIALAGYVLAVLVYTFWTKHWAWLDAVWLAGLYTWRIYLGALAIEVPVSRWLLLFSIFAFMSLALLKRFTELRRSGGEDDSASVRGYRLGAMPLVRRVGIGCALVATAVLALYVRSDTVHVLYRSPMLLWGLVPMLGYLLLRAWWEAGRGEMRDDPIVYALERPDTYVVALGVLGIIVAAR